MVGAGTDVIDGMPYRAFILSQLTNPSHFKITVNSVSYDPGAIDVDIEVMEDVPDITDMEIRMAVLEDRLLYGGELYDDVLLDMLPDVPLTVNTVGQVQNVTANFATGTLPDNMRVVIFVQDDADKKVHATASSLPTPDYSLRYYSLGERQVVGPTGTSYFFEDFFVYNAGTMSDDFTVTVTGDIPGDWQALICDDSICYGSTHTSTLAPGEWKNYHLQVNPWSSGFAPIAIEITQAMVVPEFARAIEYTFFTDDLDLLLVDDDGAEAYEDYFIAALEENGYDYGIWNRNAGAPTAALLNYFPVLVWNVGWAFPTIDADDRAALGDYLDGGGKLFITGQDIGWELNDEGGAAYQWYRDYLHANFVNDDTNDYGLNGVPGDPISDGLDLVIQGGDGANNQDYPSDIDPADGSASVIWTYDANRNGAIKADTGVYRVVYMAFGYEAIDNPYDRAIAMNRIVTWLTYGLSDVDDGQLFRADLNIYPNPVQTTGQIRFTLPTTGQTDLQVFGPDGRLVRTLLSGEVEAGVHTIEWDGMNAAGARVPAGVYYYRFTGPEVNMSRKAIVLQ